MKAWFAVPVFAGLMTAGTLGPPSLSALGHADPDATTVTDATPDFIASLRQVGINFNNPEDAVSAGQAVCGLAAAGETGLELLTDLREANPELTINGAAQFATIAAKSYCPHQLKPAKSK